MECIDSYLLGVPKTIEVIACTVVGGTRFVMTTEGPVIMHQLNPVGMSRFGRVRWTRADEGKRRLNREEIELMRQECARMNPCNANERKFIKASRRL